MVIIRLQNYTNMVASKHGIQTFEVVVVVLLLLFLYVMFLPPIVHNPYYFWTSGLSKYTQMLEFGVAPRINPKKTCVQKRLDSMLKL